MDRQMISAPRYSPGVPNPSGEWALFESSAYSFDDGESTVIWWLMNLESGELTKVPFGDDVSEVVWVGEKDTSILYTSSKSKTSGYVGHQVCL
jgi:hypothetical protein